MNNNNQFTFKQHITFFVTSILVAGICFLLDVKFDNIPHYADKFAQSHRATVSEGALTAYQHINVNRSKIQI